MQACQAPGRRRERSRHLFLAGLRTVVDRRPTFTKRRGATLQGHGCYPLINEDGLEDGEGGEKKKNKAARGPSAAALASTMTTRAGLSPLIKGYTQLGKQHPRQAVALVECCTSVTQSKRRAGIIRPATLARGTAAKTPNAFLQLRHMLGFACL